MGAQCGRQIGRSLELDLPRMAGKSPEAVEALERLARLRDLSRSGLLEGQELARLSAEIARAAEELKVEALMHRLFRLHDLNKNGLLEEDELVQLNKKIAMLHHGKERTDKEEVKARYQTLFRAELHPEGQPVNYNTFREHIMRVLAGMGAGSCAVEQYMILEQLIVEALDGCFAFRVPSLVSTADAPYLGMISFDDEATALERYLSVPELLAPRRAGFAWPCLPGLPGLPDLACKDEDRLTVASTAASPCTSTPGSTLFDTSGSDLFGMFGTCAKLPDLAGALAEVVADASRGCKLGFTAATPNLPLLGLDDKSMKGDCSESGDGEEGDDEEGEAEAADDASPGERRRCLSISSMSMCSQDSGSTRGSPRASPMRGSPRASPSAPGSPPLSSRPCRDR
mmetsp:Transcript_35535/g.94134  ORF Transcript_35535/g.94134 Transcript_35535/m.94134 type:complete len:399 (-) Transcript_35535:192-1388(-)